MTNIDLVKKLDIVKYKNILIFDMPMGIDAFSGISFDESGGKAPYDFILSFIFSKEDMDVSIKEVFEKKLLRKNGVFHIAYPVDKFNFFVQMNVPYEQTNLVPFDKFQMNDKFEIISFMS